MTEDLSQRLNIYIIGIPISLYDGLSKEAKDILNTSSKIYCSERFFRGFQDIEAIGHKLVPFPDKLSNLPALLANEEGVIAVLATGDPNFFGITSFLMKHLGDNIIKVIPSVSSMQEAFARIRLNWEDAAFFSIHGKSKEGLLAFLLKNKKGFIFTSNSIDALFVLKTLKDNRLDDYEVYIFENLGRVDEKITKVKFPYLLKDPLSDLNVLIFQREEDLKDYIGIGLADDEYEKKKGMITKREVRVNILSLLSLREGVILWDIGAGSGSVSIEAVYNPKGVLSYAIEKDDEAFLNLKKNIKKFSAVNVKPIFARFKEVYKNLPMPDRVFIGGGGSDWIINLKEAYNSLKDKGIMVVSLVTTEHLIDSVNFFKSKGISYELYGISSFETEKIKNSSIFKSKTPIFLLKATKNENR